MGVCWVNKPVLFGDMHSYNNPQEKMNDTDLFSLKVYYHLGAYEDSLTYALGAGDLFDVNGHSEYVETIIGN